MVLKEMTYKIKYYGYSDVGYIRENNEDYWAALPDCKFFVLADGMGGHRAGEVASETAVNTICTLIKEMVVSELSIEEAQQMIQLAIERTNTTVFEKSQTSPILHGMGTTLSCLYFHPQGLIVGHVGDSRIYRLRKHKLQQLTRDHSLVGELIEKGHLTKTESEECGFKKVITKAIGTEPSVEPTVDTLEISPHDIFIMCTDGLSDMLSRKEIEEIAVRYHTIELITEALIDAAKEKGGHDNITVVTLQIT